MPEQEVTVYDRGPVLGRVEVAAQQWLLFLELGLGLVELFLAGRVYGVAQFVEGRAGGLPLVVEHPYLALVVRVPHRLPAGLEGPQRFLVVKDARGPPLVGHAVL